MKCVQSTLACLLRSLTSSNTNYRVECFTGRADTSTVQPPQHSLHSHQSQALLHDSKHFTLFRHTLKLRSTHLITHENLTIGQIGQ